MTMRGKNRLIGIKLCWSVDYSIPPSSSCPVLQQPEPRRRRTSVPSHCCRCTGPSSLPSNDERNRRWMAPRRHCSSSLTTRSRPLCPATSSETIRRRVAGAVAAAAAEVAVDVRQPGMTTVTVRAGHRDAGRRRRCSGADHGNTIRRDPVDRDPDSTSSPSSAVNRCAQLVEAAAASDARW